MEISLKNIYAIANATQSYSPEDLYTLFHRSITVAINVFTKEEVPVRKRELIEYSSDVQLKLPLITNINLNNVFSPWDMIGGFY